MIDPARFVEVIQEEGIELFAGVPDSLLKALNTELDFGSATNVVAANEGAAVALAAGHYIASGKPAAVYMQNSGLGNAVNPLASLTSPEVYGIPMLLLIGWRGEPEVPDAEQHRLQGKITQNTLEDLGIPNWMLRSDSSGWEQLVGDAIEVSVERSRPVAFLISKGTFDTQPSRPDQDPVGLTRRAAISAIVAGMPDRTLYVSTTGYTSRDLHSIRRERREAGRRDFLMVGSMGHAISIALGVALERPDTPVVCLDGDGAMAMHMGALTMVGQAVPANLTHVLLDNGVHESVGGQPTSLNGFDSAAIAAACGYRSVHSVKDEGSLAALLMQVPNVQGPTFISIKTRVTSTEGGDRPSDFSGRLAALRSDLGS